MVVCASNSSTWEKAGIHSRPARPSYCQMCPERHSLQSEPYFFICVPRESEKLTEHHTLLYCGPWFQRRKDFSPWTVHPTRVKRYLRRPPTEGSSFLKIALSFFGYLASFPLNSLSACLPSSSSSLPFIPVSEEAVGRKGLCAPSLFALGDTAHALTPTRLQSGGICSMGHPQCLLLYCRSLPSVLSDSVFFAQTNPRRKLVLSHDHFHSRCPFEK